MIFSNEHRNYQRCETAICDLKVSIDKKYWNEAELLDISAGGLKMYTTVGLRLNDKVYFQINVINLSAEFNLKVEACITRVSKYKEGFVFSMKFENVDKFTEVQLDELVNSNLKAQHDPSKCCDDGLYTYSMMSRPKPIKSYIMR